MKVFLNVYLQENIHKVLCSHMNLYLIWFLCVPHLYCSEMLHSIFSDEQSRYEVYIVSFLTKFWPPKGPGVGLFTYPSPAH